MSVFFRYCSRECNLYRKREVFFFWVMFSSMQFMQKKGGVFFQIVFSGVQSSILFLERVGVMLSDVQVLQKKRGVSFFFRYCSQVCNMYEKRCLFFQVVFINIVKMKIILIIIVSSKESIILGQGVIINIVLITIIMMHINNSALNPFTQ